MSAPVVYRRREPQTTALYTALAQGLPEFLSAAQAREQTVPRFVERELRGYLDCGRLERGFARVHCGDCGYDRLVAFSCKGRGFCPSCCGRRMADMASRWVDRLLPDVPYRQWVLSVPPPLRYLLAYDAKLLSVVVRAFVRAVFRYLRHQAKTRYGLGRVSEAEPGALVAIQRFGSALNLNVHLHVLTTDGVFVAEQDDGWRFLRLGEPSIDELQAVAWETCHKTLAYLRDEGRWLDLGEDPGALDGEDALALDTPLLSDIYGASVVGRLALGPRSGQRVLTFVSHPPRAGQARLPGVMGFDAHAGVCVDAGERKKLERLCRYLFRPPAAAERFEALADGRVSVRLKRPWSDGTTHVVLTPLELTEKLAALVPPPRANQVRYFGVFAPRSKMRARLMPVAELAPGGGVGEAASTQSCAHRQRWAVLMRRVFDLDVLACPKCNSRMQQIAFITDSVIIDRMLTSVRRAADSPLAA